MKFENMINTIQLGDCYEMIKNIPDNSIDLIVTDPPYEMVSGGHGVGKLADRKTTQNEEFREQGLYDGFKNDILLEFVRVLKKINIYIWCSKNQIYQIMDFFNKLDKELNFDIITWHKTNPAPLANMTYLNDTEYCINFREQGCIIRGELEQKKKYYVTSLNKNDKDLYKHPTIKPINIIKNLIINSSQENDIVLDCFCGSGTTCVASKELNRNFIGMEINKEYYKIAVNRLNGINANGQMSIFTDFEQLEMSDNSE